jgi:23S rRNA (cytidine1920-2'-O)/16S rRNA (cytidine1409-2'-O)-methyltransferase
VIEKRTRLDEALVIRGLFSSRARARDAVLRGCIKINGAAASKVAQNVSDRDVIVVDDPAQKYVSRAALKLVAALDHCALSPAEKFCLDIGASTGGFTQVLLERGAQHVFAIDVGHGQMHASLRDDPRVTNLEGVNARELPPFAQVPSFIVADVSFISLKIALPPALALSPSSADLIALIKPQFEVGRENLGKGGIVRNEALLQNVCADIHSFLDAQGWSPQPVFPSPISGGDGNKEFLVAAKKR